MSLSSRMLSIPLRNAINDDNLKKSYTKLSEKILPDSSAPLNSPFQASSDRLEIEYLFPI